MRPQVILSLVVFLLILFMFTNTHGQPAGRKEIRLKKKQERLLLRKEQLLQSGTKHGKNLENKIRRIELQLQKNALKIEEVKIKAAVMNAKKNKASERKADRLAKKAAAVIANKRKAAKRNGDRLARKAARQKLKEARKANKLNRKHGQGTQGKMQIPDTHVVIQNEKLTHVGGFTNIQPGFVVNDMPIIDLARVGNHWPQLNLNSVGILADPSNQHTVLFQNGASHEPAKYEGTPATELSKQDVMSGGMPATPQPTNNVWSGGIPTTTRATNDVWSGGMPATPQTTKDVWSGGLPATPQTTKDVWSGGIPATTRATNDVWSGGMPATTRATNDVWSAGMPAATWATNDVWSGGMPATPQTTNNVWSGGMPATPQTTKDVWSGSMPATPPTTKNALPVATNPAENAWPQPAQGGWPPAPDAWSLILAGDSQGVINDSPSAVKR